MKKFWTNKLHYTYFLTSHLYYLIATLSITPPHLCISYMQRNINADFSLLLLSHEHEPAGSWAYSQLPEKVGFPIASLFLDQLMLGFCGAEARLGCLIGFQPSCGNTNLNHAAHCHLGSDYLDKSPHYAL